jgi:hypothetical protein
VNLVEENPTVKAEAEVFPEELETTIGIEFLDAKTGAPIGLEDGKVVTVTFTGKDQSSVKSYDGVSGTSYTSDFGLLVVSTSKTPTANNPLDVNVVAHLDGYVNTSQRIQAFDTGEVFVQVNMVKIDDTPNGITAKVNSDISTTSGVTESTVVIEAAATSETTSTTTKTTVTVPAGIEMKDKSGNVLRGTVKSTLVYFSIEEDGALGSFPGGFDASVDRNGSEEDGNFVTAGFVSLDMEVGGTKVSTFSQPITITTEVPAATINPSTGNTIQTGETIDIWSYDTETGKWTYENTATFGAQLNNGNFEATMTPTHLSYWNLDWHYAGKCRVGATITIDAPEMTSPGYMRFDLLYKNSGRMFRTLSKRVQNGQTYTFMNAPPQDFIIKPSTSSCSGVSYSGQLEFNGCGSGGTLQLAKTSSEGGSTININADVSGYCTSNPTVLIKPTGTMYIRKKGACGRWIRARMVKGKITINNLNIGATYKGYFYYGGVWHTRTAVLTQETTDYVLNGPVPTSICQ